MVDIDAGVDNVNVHAASVADGTVDVVERETDLVDAVETPGSHGARVDHSVFFNILDGVRGTKLDDGTGIENDLRGVHGIQQHYDCLICVQYFISTTVSLSSGADPGFSCGGGGGAQKLCALTHITSANPNSLSAGVQLGPA